jgi:hypothetical protein
LGSRTILGGTRILDINILDVDRAEIQERMLDHVSFSWSVLGKCFWCFALDHEWQTNENVVDVRITMC